MPYLFIFGDSITWGAWDSEGGWAARVRKQIDKQHLNEPDFWSPVYNLGISGDTSRGVLERFSREIESRLMGSAESPTILLAIGINDSSLVKGKPLIELEEYKNNLSAIFQLSQKYTAKIYSVGLFPVDESLLMPVPWDASVMYPSKRAKEFNEALCAVSKSFNVPFVNLWNEEIDFKSLLFDGLHPNDKGHEYIAEEVQGELRKLDYLKGIFPQ